MSKRGTLLVLSGPSGVGKSTVLRKVMAGREDMAFSVSATTRAPRPGEEEGVDYFFVTRERFDEMVADGELLEHAEFVGNCYGTPRSQVEKRLESGITVVLDIEVQGASQVKALMPEALTVFLAPPSLEALEQRLRGRGTETEEKIRSRLETARRELLLAPTYDFTVVNDDADRAASELAEILENWDNDPDESPEE
ncbi:MAG: guanylate kinase [Oscillospiraceae bacterium]|nr:guanylate kinase [Oscillospiraceae bacterium]